MRRHCGPRRVPHAHLLLLLVDDALLLDDDDEHLLAVGLRLRHHLLLLLELHAHLAHLDGRLAQLLEAILLKKRACRCIAAEPEQWSGLRVGPSPQLAEKLTRERQLLALARALLPEPPRLLQHSAAGAEAAGGAAAAAGSSDSSSSSSDSDSDSDSD
mgnify:CR=1 FL=1